MGEYKIGEPVLLKGRYAMGNTAVVISFVVPLVLLLVVALLAVHVLHLSDLYAALCTFGGVGLYYLILSFFRKSLSKKFVFYIEKIQSN
jgi:positive regulator of sigma(E), rseC/mucC family